MPAAPCSSQRLAFITPPESAKLTLRRAARFFILAEHYEELGDSQHAFLSLPNSTKSGGKTSMVLDKPTLNRLEEINRLPEDAKGYIFNHLDMMVRDFKNKHAYSLK